MYWLIVYLFQWTEYIIWWIKFIISIRIDLFSCFTRAIGHQILGSNFETQLRRWHHQLGICKIFDKWLISFSPIITQRIRVNHFEISNIYWFATGRKITMRVDEWWGRKYETYHLNCIILFVYWIIRVYIFFVCNNGYILYQVMCAEALFTSRNIYLRQI